MEKGASMNLAKNQELRRLRQQKKQANFTFSQKRHNSQGDDLLVNNKWQSSQF